MRHWVPNSVAELERLLSEEVVQLAQSEREVWLRCAVQTPRPHPILRSSSYGIERVYIVAQNGDAVVIFDDVEDEFAVAIVENHQPIQRYESFGKLCFALRRLNASAP